MSEWISVKERLPEPGKVLVTDGKSVHMTNGAWLYRTPDGETRAPSNYGAGITVTHWMPASRTAEGGLTMGQHKHNPTAIAAKNGELPPNPKRIGKREWERMIVRKIEGQTGIERFRQAIKEVGQ